MKTTGALLAIHKTYEDKQVTLYVYDGIEVKKLSNEDFFKLEVEPDTTIRLTAVNALDAIVGRLEDLGATIVSTNWHNTGITKGLAPEDIVKAYYESSADFRVFKYNKPLADLRNTIAMRNAMAQACGDLSRRVQQIGRNIGMTKDDMLEDARFKQMFALEDAIEKSIGFPNKHGKLVSLDTEVNNQAKKIPACVLFNKVAGITSSYVTAATVMSIIQDIERFPNVASLWSYFGMGVVDGKAPKRQTGVASNWSPAGRRVLYQLGSSLIKNKNNPWRAFFEDAKAGYLAKHETTCGCKAKAGHPDAQARRKMVKEIMKRFFIAARGEEFVSGHKNFENQRSNAAIVGM